MDKKTMLQAELLELDGKLNEMGQIEKPGKADLLKVNATCDRIEAVQTELRALEVSSPEVRTVRDERTFYRNFGGFLQKVAGAGLEPGRELAPGISTGVIHRDLLRVENRAASGMGEVVPSTGGFLVGSEYSEELFTKASAASRIFGKCRQYRLRSNANTLKIPAVDESSRAQGSRGGSLRLYWEDEGNELTASRPKFAMCELTAHKLTGLCYAVSELLEDSETLGQVVSDEFQKEFGFVLDDMCLRGTGAGQPLGILNSPCLVSVTGTGTASTITAADIVQMWAQLWPACEEKAEWYMNKDVLPMLAGIHSEQLTVPGTPAGDLLWQPAGGFAGQPFATLFSKRVNFIEQASTLGTVGDIILADFSQYAVLIKGGLQSAVSAHVRFLQDEQTFRFLLRTDGQSLWSTSVAPYKGSNAQSPFIVIATR